jgi:DNA-binding FrmR family transcriptional regulator
MTKKKVLKNEIPLVNKNIIHIHLDKHTVKEKKNKKRRQKKYRFTNKPFPKNEITSNVASLITNRPQELNLSTASNREKDNIILDAINAVKRQNDLLTIKDKLPEILTIFESPKPPPTTLKQTKRITDFYHKTPEKNLYDTYSKDKVEEYNRVEELGEVKKRGRPMASQKANESNDDYINRIKKGKGYLSTIQSVIPTPRKKKIHPEELLKKDVIPESTTPKQNKEGIKTRAQLKEEAAKKQEEINKNFQMNFMESFL